MSPRLLLLLAASLAAAQTFPTPQSGPALPHKLVPGWGQLPPGWNIVEASGVAVDKDDNVWLFHRGKHPIIQFNREGKVLQSFDDAPVVSAHGIKAGPDGNIWTIDVGAHRVVTYTPQGRIVQVIGSAGGQPGTQESKDAFNRPTGIAFAPDGSYYVSDGYANSRVVKFGRDGLFQLQWGSKGNLDGQFSTVHDVAVDARGRVYVADRENRRLQVFDAEGRFIAKWTHLGSPWGLAYSARENALYMCDGYNNRIIKVNTEGQLLGELSGYGKLPGRLDFAHHIAVDSRGALYVTEIKNWRVQKFQP